MGSVLFNKFFISHFVMIVIREKTLFLYKIHFERQEKIYRKRCVQMAEIHSPFCVVQVRHNTLYAYRRVLEGCCNPRVRELIQLGTEFKIAESIP